MNNDYMFEDDENKTTDTSDDYSYYNNSDYSNPDFANAYYGNSGNSNPGQGEAKPPKSKSGNGLAIASMVLGIVSVVLFCTCFNVLTAIAAAVTGIIFLAAFNTGKKGDKAMAISGIVMAVVSIIAFIVSWCIIVSVIGSPTIMNDLDDVYGEYFNEQIQGEDPIL